MCLYETAVRADRMRGGRNKFGPMYKRDRARKLQIMRQRQLAVQALRAAEGNTSQLSPTGYQQPYSNMNIKQEIQIPQVNFMLFFLLLLFYSLFSALVMLIIAGLFIRWGDIRKYSFFVCCSSTAS